VEMMLPSHEGRALCGGQNAKARRLSKRIPSEGAYLAGGVSPTHLAIVDIVRWLVVVTQPGVAAY